MRGVLLASLLEGAMPRRDVGLRPEDRLHARAAPGLEKVHGPVHDAVVRERERGHLHPRRGLEELRDPRGTVEQGVFGMAVQVAEALPQDRSPSAWRGKDGQAANYSNVILGPGPRPCKDTSAG